MKYMWTVSFSLPKRRNDIRRTNYTKVKDTDKKKKEYMDEVCTLLHCRIIAILGPDYVSKKRKPDLKLKVICLGEQGLQAGLAKAMRDDLLKKLEETSNVLKLF